MHFFDAVILGVIEGVTEFLPISSTGHMILASAVLHLEQTDFLKSFEIIIQLGAILAVVVLYAKTFLKNFDLLKKIFVAFVPTAVIGLVFYKIVKVYLLGNNAIVIASLFFGGLIILWFSEWEKKNNALLEKGTITNSSILSYKQAALIGVFQSIAIIPGVSRSAATIIGGRLLGVKRKEIVEFSFLLAVPTMVAAAGLDILKNYHTLIHGNLGLLLTGFIVSFVVALFAIKGFINFVKRYSFEVFGWYRVVIAIVAVYFLYL